MFDYSKLMLMNIKIALNSIKKTLFIHNFANYFNYMYRYILVFNV
jgi:hypothetical protein